MRLALAAAALAGAAITLGGCYYYPPGEYGPPPAGGSYGPPPGYNEQGPPPQGEYGPPPGEQGQGAPPPPQGQNYGPPPEGQGYGPPPQGPEYGAMSGGAASTEPAPPPGYSARWCANHPHKCRRLRRMEAQGAYGPPPGEGSPPPQPQQ